MPLSLKFPVAFFLELAAAVFFFSPAAPGAENQLPDADFHRGFTVEPILQVKEPPRRLGNIFFDGDNRAEENSGTEEPAWILAPHYTRYDITKTALLEENGWLIHGTRGEEIALREANGERILRLSVRTDQQYDRPRRLNEPWPHLLLVQSFPADRFNGLDHRSLVFSFDVKIDSWENCMSSEEYDRTLHTAQTTAYFIVKNVRKGSPDQNDYIWLGIPIFDARYRVILPYCALDGNPEVLGTGKLIYTLGGEDAYESVYGGDNPYDGQWCHGEIDLTTKLKEALDRAKERGFLTQTEISDLAVVHFNVGWEVPGTFRASMEIKNLRLAFAEAEKQAPRAPR